MSLAKMRTRDLLALFRAALDELHRRSRRGRRTCYDAIVPRCTGSAVGGHCTCWAGVPYPTRAEVAARAMRGAIAEATAPPELPPRPFAVQREGRHVVVMIGGAGVSLTPADARRLAIAIRSAARGAA